MKIRKSPSDHHPWCNFFTRLGPCQLCERLEKLCPVHPDDTQESLMERYFPENIVLNKSREK